MLYSSEGLREFFVPFVNPGLTSDNTFLTRMRELCSSGGQSGAQVALGGSVRDLSLTSSKGRDITLFRSENI
jgi:hypothetical protein